MVHPIDRLSAIAFRRLRRLGHRQPNAQVVAKVIEVAYLASMRPEEARFVRTSVTYADPTKPDRFGPPRRRADYPSFTKLAREREYSVSTLVKLARAVDHWSGSIAVFGNSAGALKCWGIVDQLVETNVRLNHEGQHGFSNPGAFSVTIDGVGDISVYCDDIFLGALRGDSVVSQERDVLGSPVLAGRLAPYFLQRAKAIARTVPGIDVSTALSSLLHMWARTVARLCIGVRRLGTGGAFILTPRALTDSVELGCQVAYARLGAAVTLNVLDGAHHAEMRAARRRVLDRSGAVPHQMHRDEAFAEADAEDRESELTAATKLVTSFGAVDGAVVLTPTLAVCGFGAKITAADTIRTVYDGPSYVSDRVNARRIDLSRFGTRHLSMLRYCRADRHALGIVVSQDGHVRVVVPFGRTLTLWDTVRLVNHTEYASHAVKAYRVFQKRRRRAGPAMLGYSRMPKTIEALLGRAK